MGVIRNEFEFEPMSSVTHRIGIGVFLFALLVQPLIGPLVGREWMQMEIFGMAPDPTVSRRWDSAVTARRVFWELMIIPLFWCALSGAVPWTMGPPDALLMPFAALAVLCVAGTTKRR